MSNLVVLWSYFQPLCVGLRFMYVCVFVGVGWCIVFLVVIGQGGCHYKCRGLNQASPCRHVLQALWTIYPFLKIFSFSFLFFFFPCFLFSFLVVVWLANKLLYYTYLFLADHWLLIRFEYLGMYCTICHGVLWWDLFFFICTFDLKFVVEVHICGAQTYACQSLYFLTMVLTWYFSCFTPLDDCYGARYYLSY